MVLETSLPKVMGKPYMGVRSFSPLGDVNIIIPASYP